MTESTRQSQPVSSQLVLAGRLRKREHGVYQLELLDGLTVDLAEDDCEHVEERTDPVTLRPTVKIHLRADRPITATFQPHLYRVLAAAAAVPFVFNAAATAAQGGSVLGLAYVSAAAPGGGGGPRPHHTTRMMCTNWMGTTQEDGTKGDSSNEPDEIHLP